jgi:hypothetical protein
VSRAAAEAVGFELSRAVDAVMEERYGVVEITP